jgi:hypothetical protein
MHGATDKAQKQVRMEAATSGSGNDNSGYPSTLSVPAGCMCIASNAGPIVATTAINKTKIAAAVSEIGSRGETS